MGFFSDVFKGSGGSIVGGILGAGASLLNNNANQSHADFWARQNIALQKEFAQNSIKWRVEDAKRAGVHPMAALGIQPSSFSPVSASFQSSDPGAYLADMGQNIDRAVLAGKDADARKQAEDFNNMVNGLTLEKMGLENDLLRAEIASKKAVRYTAATPPAPKINTSRPFDDQPDSAPPPSGGVGTFSSDPASLFTGVVAGDGIIPVYSPDVADPLSESLHSDLAAKYAYLGGVERREILGPPRSTWSASQTRRVESGKYHWVFDSAEWIWRLEPNSNYTRYSKNRREASGPLAKFSSADYR